jgi:protein-tyrosine-phosphatase
VKVGSVGLLDLGSAPALPEVLEVARSAGLDLTRHRSRHLHGIDVSTVDLVVGLERSHVAAAVVEANVPYERTFTLKEIVRLLAGLAPVDESDLVERARRQIARAHERRSEDPAFIPGEDIEDPFGGPRSGFVEMAETVASLCESLVDGLFGKHARVQSEQSVAGARGRA